MLSVDGFVREELPICGRIHIDNVIKFLQNWRESHTEIDAHLNYFYDDGLKECRCCVEYLVFKNDEVV